MKNRLLTLVILALVFGMVVIGCDDGSNSGGSTGANSTTGSGNEKLPAASGNNAVSGKIYYERLDRITFSATVSGDAKGTYVRASPNRGTYASGVKFTYRDKETGSYTWNEGAKTVTLKPEKLTSGITSTSSSDDYITFEVNMDLWEIEQLTVQVCKPRLTNI